MNRLVGTAALITGAAHWIGAETARRLVAADLLHEPGRGRARTVDGRSGAGRASRSSPAWSADTSSHYSDSGVAQLPGSILGRIANVLCQAYPIELRRPRGQRPLQGVHRRLTSLPNSRPLPRKRFDGGAPPLPVRSPVPAGIEHHCAAIVAERITCCSSRQGLKVRSHHAILVDAHIGTTAQRRQRATSRFACAVAGALPTCAAPNQQCGRQLQPDASADHRTVPAGEVTQEAGVKDQPSWPVAVERPRAKPNGTGALAL
jgi:hypothetical protein